MQFLTKILSHVTSIKVKSVTDPFLKYAAVFAVLTIIVAYLKLPEWLIICFASFTGFLLIVYSIGFCYFAITKPSYLRSETGQIQLQKLEMLGDKEKQFKPEDQPPISITSPHIKHLEDQ